MRVLMITTEYPPNIFGGGGAFMHNLVRGLRELGVEACVITRGGPAEDSEACVIRFNTPDLPPRHVWFQVGIMKRVIEVVKDLGPDVIHFNSFSGGLLLKRLTELSRAPSVVTLHGYPRHRLHISAYSVGRGASAGQLVTYVLGYPVWEAIMRRELRLSHLVVTVSGFLKRYLVSDYNIDPAKVRVVPNGVDVVEELSMASECGDVDAELLVSGGRMFYEKGHALLLYVMKKLLRKGAGRLRLEVFGDGPYKPWIEKKIRDLGLGGKIRLLGWLPRKKMICKMAEASAVILPSLYETGVLPILGFEAVALKKPLIALWAEYVEEALRYGFRLFVGSGIDGLADKVIEVLDNGPEVRESVEANYRLLMEGFTSRVMAERYLRIYEEAVKHWRR